MVAIVLAVKKAPEVGVDTTETVVVAVGFVEVATTIGPTGVDDRNVVVAEVESTVVDVAVRVSARVEVAREVERSFATIVDVEIAVDILLTVVEVSVVVATVVAVLVTVGSAIIVLVADTSDELFFTTGTVVAAVARLGVTRTVFVITVVGASAFVVVAYVVTFVLDAVYVVTGTSAVVVDVTVYVTSRNGLPTAAVVDANVIPDARVVFATYENTGCVFV